MLRHLVSSRPALHDLERRLLFATINVDDYGAIPNDNQNDLLAIQNAIDASSAGDTILFPGGVYNLSDFGLQPHDSDGNGFIVPGNRNYLGLNGATLRGSDFRGPVLYPQNFNGNNRASTNNVTISHLTFDGGGLYVDNVSGKNQNFLIDYNVFNMNMGGQNRNGITNNSGWEDSRISNNYFTGYNCSFSIYGYNYDGLTIANNEFVNVNAGMHIDAFGNSRDLLVEQNYITGAKGMGMEFQSSATDLVFQDNWYEHPNLSTVQQQNSGTMAFSLILDKSQNILIRRNVVIAPERPDGIGCRIGFEVGGDNTLVEDNYINGINHVLAMNDGDGPASVIAQNNHYENAREAPSNTFPATGTLTLINNGPNVVLSPTMEARIAAMQKPGIGAKRYGDPLPDDEPPPDAPAQPGNLDGAITAPGEVTFTWFDGSGNELGFQLQMLQPDGITWQTVYTVGANVTTATVQNVADQARFRVIAYNAGGNSQPSNTFTVVAMPSIPGNVTGSALSSNQVALHWIDTSTNESDFQIQLLAADGITWLNVGTVGANVTTFTINGVAAGQTYVFRVVAHNPNGYSDVSNATTIRTPLSDVVSGVISTVRRAKPVLIYQGNGSTAVSPIMGTSA